MRVYIVGGKGGVGKTSVAGFLSMILSRRGKTRVLSTDIAHSLRDFFRVKGKGERFSVMENLEAYEPDVKRALKSYMGKIERKVRKSFSPIVYHDFEPFLRFSSTDPSNYDTVLFEIIKEEVLRGDVDFLVVDTGATAQIIKFFLLPERLHHWYELLIKWREKYLSVKAMVREEVGEDKLLNHVKNKRREVEKFSNILYRSSFIWVLEPAELSIRETLRTMKELQKRIQITGFIFNKVKEHPLRIPGVLKKHILVEIPLFEKEPTLSGKEGELFLLLLENFLTQI